ncbi:unnamed protein product [Blepharisma stoltei]|uniref:Plasmid pRiA4b Orf3-like domain-containing protein n=1 Tax=Blepharisma stoltei TaxID=1481888 RepID=A0AAU9K7M2_9CILI|nr:unnamed protein product [Blepharisma stoltei]
MRIEDLTVLEGNFYVYEIDDLSDIEIFDPYYDPDSNAHIIKDECDSDIEMIIENTPIKDELMEIVPVKEEDIEIQELVDLTAKQRNKIISPNDVKLGDILKLDKLTILKPEDAILLFKPNKEILPQPPPTSQNIRCYRHFMERMTGSLAEPSPGAPPPPRRNRGRRLPWDPLKNPRRNTSLKAGVYDLPRVSEEELLKSHSKCLFESFQKIHRRKIKGQLTSIVHEKIVIEFKFEMLNLPRIIMRTVQMDYLSTFHQVHMAICDICGYVPSEYPNYKFVFFNLEKKPIYLGDSGLSEEKKAEQREYMRNTVLVDPLHPDYCELNYQIDDEENVRFRIKILKFADKIEAYDYPMCIRAKHVGPQGMRIDQFREVLEKLENGGNEENEENREFLRQYESWRINKINKLDVEFPSFVTSSTIVRMNVCDERISFLRSSQ